VAGYPPSPPGVLPSVRYSVSEVTAHLTTNAEVLRRFLDLDISVEGRPGEEGEVRVLAPGASGELVPLAR
jgi:RNA 3'-terminal phosphate cyclase (ATP)